MSKLMQFNDEALKSILRGIRLLSKAVQATMGPKGKNVVIKREFGPPLSTKDGVTVAEEVNLKDPFENIGAQIVKEVASKTADRAGDGTTTAIVLAHAIYRAGVKNVAAGANPAALKQGIEIAVEAVVKKLEAMAKPIETSKEIEQVAAISANNDPSIGEILARAMEKVGKDGIISTTEGRSMKTEVDVKEGLQFDQGFLSPYFINNPEMMTTEFSDAALLIVDKKLSSARDLVPILEKVMAEGAKPLLIIAEDVEGEALATLIMNKLQAGLPLCAVKAPGFGGHRKSMLEDISILTGATVISEEAGLDLKEVDPSVLGFVKTIQINKEETILIDGRGSASKIEERAQQIRSLLDHPTTSDFEKEKLEQRLAMLVGGIAVIQVGAATETEMKEKKARVEDALHATRAAIAKGIVPGGGVALLRAVSAIDALKLEGDQKIGAQIVREACFTPAAIIAANCGKQGNLIAEKIYESQGAVGYNGLTDAFADLMQEGIIDPVLVTISALVNASSVAGLLLRTAAIIAEKKKPTPKTAPMDGGMGGMGGMGMM